MLIRYGYEMTLSLSFTTMVQPASGSRAGGFEPPHRDD